MKIKTAEFVISNSDYKLCPKESLPEYAFIGRSNVGKSSLINSLVNKKSLAKTSSKPGKTQLINHFLINKNWFMVDLPGYGYATTSKAKRREFVKIIQSYLENRRNLICLFVLIDIRIDPQKIDLDFMCHLAKLQIPFVIIFTKADKISNTQITEKKTKYQRSMLNQWQTLPEIFISSAKKGNGRKEILSFISKYNLKFKPI